MTVSPVMTEPDPLYLLFEPVYSSLAVTISSLQFITTCMHNSIYIRCLIFTVSSLPSVIESLNHLSMDELVQSATLNSMMLWLACNLWHTGTGTKYISTSVRCCECSISV